MATKTKHKTLFSGKYLKILTYKGWEFVKRNGCTGIVVISPLTEDGKVIFVEQYRVPLGKNVVEFPAGLVGDCAGARRESMASAAKRELWEETGYAAKKMTFVMEGPVSSGMSAQQIAFYTATGLRKTGPGGGDETENIQVHAVPLKQAERWLKTMRKKGKLVDPKVYAGLYFLNSSKKKA